MIRAPVATAIGPRIDGLDTMTNPFMTLNHCAAMACRRAIATRSVVHVIATGEEAMPLAILDEYTLLACGDQLGFEDLRFTADPAELDTQLSA